MMNAEKVFEEVVKLPKAEGAALIEAVINRAISQELINTAQIFGNIGEDEQLAVLRERSLMFSKAAMGGDDRREVELQAMGAGSLAECSWVHNADDEDEVWDTSCDHKFESSNDYGPINNEFRFCCYCGGRLKEITVRYA